MPLSACPICNRNGCGRAAAGVLAFEIFPPAAVLAHYRTTRPITHLVVGLELCDEHAAEIVPATFLGAHLEHFARVVETASGTVVDREATKAVLLPFDHADVLRLRAAAGQPPSDSKGSR